MGPRYARYFTQRLETLTSQRYAAVSPFTEDAYRAIRRGIEQASLPYPLEVRPDAVLFLTVNFYELVILPAVDVEPRQDSSFILDEVPKDVRMIVESAAQRATALGDAEISGHEVVQALSDSWDRLALAQPWRWEQ